MSRGIRDEERHKASRGCGRRIVGCAVFVALAGWLLVQAAYLVRPAVYGGGNYRFVWTGFYAEEKNSMDVVLVGSSEIYRYVDTPYLYENYGITSYNLSCGSMLAETFSYAIEESQRCQSPQLYIVGIRPFLYGDRQPVTWSAALHRMSDNMYFSSPVRWRMLFDLLDSWEDRIEYGFDLLTYHDNWDDLTWEYRQYIGNRYASTMKGWRNIFASEAQDPADDYLGEAGPLPLTAENEENLVTFLEYCEEYELPVLFISPPWLCTQEARGMSLTVREIIESYGYTLIDMNDPDIKQSLNIDYGKDFYNFKHMTTWGAEKVTDYLGAYLAEHYTWPESHSESVTASWNRAVQTYHKELAAAEEAADEAAAADGEAGVLTEAEED